MTTPNQLTTDHRHRMDNLASRCALCDPSNAFCPRRAEDAQYSYNRDRSIVLSAWRNYSAPLWHIGHRLWRTATITDVAAGFLPCRPPFAERRLLHMADDREDEACFLWIEPPESFIQLNRHRLTKTRASIFPNPRSSRSESHKQRDCDGRHSAFACPGRKSDFHQACLRPDSVRASRSVSSR